MKSRLAGGGDEAAAWLAAFAAPRRESRVREGAPGPPPRPGLVWNDSTHRWTRPDGGDAPQSRDEAAAELEQHEGGRPLADSLDHDDYMLDAESGDPGAADRFKEDFARALAEKDEYAAGAAEFAGAGDEFKGRYAKGRAALAAAGGGYAGALSAASAARRAVDELRGEVEALRLAELEVEDHGEPPGRPKNPAKLPQYEAALAEFKARRAAALEKARAKRREEVEAVRAQMAGPLGEYKAAKAKARQAHRVLAAAGDGLAALVRSLHAGPPAQ